jgi:hypothetical protein
MTFDQELERPVRARGASRKARRDAFEASVPLPEGLTAGDLIALLEDLDPATPVVIGGQYGGYESARSISAVPLQFNVNRMDGFGPHDRAAPGGPPQAVAVAVLVNREAQLVE